MTVITTTSTAVLTPGTVLPPLTRLTISESQSSAAMAASGHLEAMTTQTMSGLEALLSELGMKIPIPQLPGADVLNKPLDIGRSYLADILTTIVECDLATACNSIQLSSNIYSGDFSVILPKLSHGSGFSALAIDLIQKFPPCPIFNKPFQDGVHLRVMFSPQTLPRLLFPYINDRKDTYGRDIAIGLRDPSLPNLGSKKLVVDFSSPNIDSEFKGKHLRSTILGACIVTLYRKMGWDVTKINYIGDWGKQVGLLGVGWEKFGSEELYQADPRGHLLDVYHKIDDLLAPEQAARKEHRGRGKEIEPQGLFAERNAYFKRMEEGDEKALELWKRVRDVNVENYKKLYSRLNVAFDECSGESQVSAEAMAEVEEILRNKGLCDEIDGSLAVDMSKHTGRHGAGRAVIRDRTGSSTYTLRELAAALDRARKYAFDKMIYVAADDNNLHFKRVIKLLQLMDMPDLAHKLEHVSFNEASKMSEKIGRGHMVDEILDQCQRAMHKSLSDNPEKAALLGNSEDTAVDVGITALLVQELSAKRSNDHAFDVDKMVSFEPGTGPDLQYWYARLCSLLRARPAATNFSDEDFTPFGEDEKFDLVDLVRLLNQYPDITLAAYKSLEPVTILSYLFNVTGLLPYCIGKDQDVNGPSGAQAMLYEATRRVLENGMQLLRITPVAKI